MPKEFVKVASVHDLSPGDMKRVEVGDERILVANVEGEFFAICDICSHADAALSDGDLDEEMVTCPLHGSEFNVKTGEVQNPPAEENVAVYSVRVEGDNILVGPAQDDS